MFPERKSYAMRELTKVPPRVSMGLPQVDAYVLKSTSEVMNAEAVGGSAIFIKLNLIEIKHLRS